MTQCEDSLRAVAHVPPSVQSVYCSLYGHDPMTGQELRETTGLPRRTVYAALQRLKELGLLRERPSLRDTRQTYYWISGNASTAPAPIPMPAAPSLAPWTVKPRDQ